MGDTSEPFRDLVFNGTPSEYRLFRRKIILNVASMEERHVRLAGPRIFLFHLKQLKGFNGVRSSSSRGMDGEAGFAVRPRDHVCAFSSVETSATRDGYLGNLTISSPKHGIENLRLAQASNGHLVPEEECGEFNFSLCQ